MQIELSTDHNIEGKERLGARVEELVTHALGKFSDAISRVEVHLSDEISSKSGSKGQTRCVMEARLEGRKPIAVDDKAASVDQAVKGAAKKLANSVETIVGRLGEKR